MKRSVVIIIGIIICLSLGAVVKAQAQGIDQERMDRDLAVTSNVLKTLLNEQDTRGYLWGGIREIEAEYRSGYGVVFTLPRSFAYLMSRNNVMAGVKVQETDASSDQEDKERQDEVNTLASTFGGLDEDELVEKLRTFLVDYSNLIGQLRSSDKIVVKQQNSGNEFIYLYSESTTWVRDSDRQPGAITAEIKVADLEAYRAGKASRDQTLDKVSITRMEEVEIEEDVRLFAGIIQTVYESRISRTYYMSGRPEIERLKDFGVIYHVQVYSSSPQGFGEDTKHSIPTLRLENVSQQERDKKITELYPEFLKGFKENMVEYGRTIRSLKADENVTMRIKLTKCAGCGIPETIELNVKASVLADYGSGKISKDNAVSKVTLKEVGKQ